MVKPTTPSPLIHASLSKIFLLIPLWNALNFLIKYSSLYILYWTETCFFTFYITLLLHCVHCNITNYWCAIQFYGLFISSLFQICMGFMAISTPFQTFQVMDTLKILTNNCLAYFYSHNSIGVFVLNVKLSKCVFLGSFHGGAAPLMLSFRNLNGNSWETWTEPFCKTYPETLPPLSA